MEKFGLYSITESISSGIGLLIVIVLAIISSFLIASLITKAKETEESEEDNKKSKIRLFLLLSSWFTAFISVWYMFNFTIGFGIILFSVVGSFIYVVFLLDNNINSIKGKGISINFKSVLMTFIGLAVVSIVSAIMQSSSASYTNQLSENDKLVYLTSNKDIQVAEKAREIDLIADENLLKVYLFGHRWKNDPVKSKTINLINKLESRGPTFPNDKRHYMYSGIKSFLQENYTNAQKSFQKAEIDTLSKLTKALILIPKLESLLGADRAYYDAQETAMNKIMSISKGMVADEAPKLLNIDAINAKEARMMFTHVSAVLLFYIVSLLSVPSFFLLLRTDTN